jgi:predicted esterase
MRFANATNAAIKVFNPNITFKTYNMGHSACDAELKDVEKFLQEVIPKK